MSKIRQNRWVWLAVLTAAAFGRIDLALAAPPLLRAAAAHVDSRPAAPMHLDLRAPTVSAIEPAERNESFPSAVHHPDLGLEDSAAHSSGMTAQAAQGREISPAEAFARRVHREGLPVAKLWQSKSALVSLGLNARGKPGIWLTQKTH
jgi:hypothetical protein